MRSARARSYALGVTLVALAFGSSAQAFETAGKFGVGYDADLNGINLRYFANRVGIDLTWGLALQSPRGDGEETRVDMVFVPRLVYALKMHEKINLNTGGGLTFEVLGSNASDDTDFSLGLFGRSWAGDPVVGPPGRRGVLWRGAEDQQPGGEPGAEGQHQLRHARSAAEHRQRRDLPLLLLGGVLP
jgi:hypothetical protein